MDLFTLIAILFAIAAVAGIAQQGIGIWREIRLADAEAIRSAMAGPDRPEGDVPELPAALRRRDVH